MRKYLFLVAATAAAAALPFKANAYVADLASPTPVVNTSVDPTHATVGDSFDLTSVGIANYTPAAGDPVIGLGGVNDLALYKLNVHGIVNTVSPDPVWGPTVAYGGNYLLFYDQNTNNTFDAGDFRVSSGTLNASATYDQTGSAPLVGTLNQLLGPETAPFADLGPSVSISGFYTHDNNGAPVILRGQISREPGVVPEPGSLALLATGLLPLLGLRRRK